MSMEHFDDQVRRFSAKLIENSVLHVAQLYNLYRKQEISEEEFSLHNEQIQRYRREFIEKLDELVAAEDDKQAKQHIDNILTVIYGYGETVGRIDQLVSSKVTVRAIENAKLH